MSKSRLEDVFTKYIEFTPLKIKLRPLGTQNVLLEVTGASCTIWQRLPQA